jgi:hypothetical protein
LERRGSLAPDSSDTSLRVGKLAYRIVLSPNLVETYDVLIMAPIPIDLDRMLNYSFCELIDLGVEIDEDWYNVGNIEYDALDDLRGDFPQLFEDDIMPVN